MQAHPEKPWNYDCLSINPNITWEIVEDHPEKPWAYRNLSMNKMYYNKPPDSQYVLK